VGSGKWEVGNRLSFALRASAGKKWKMATYG